MNIIFPESFVSSRVVDSDFKDQADAFIAAGHRVVVISDKNIVKTELNGLVNGRSIYRGWMKSKDEYTAMFNALHGYGLDLITSPESYIECHYLPGWYDKVFEYTAKTVIFKSVEDITDQSIPNWEKYFVKDYVKSLTTKRGSVAKDVSEIRAIVCDIEKYRGQIEGGICLRQFESYIDDSEERYFIYKGIPYSPNGIIPGLVKEIANRIDAQFFSVDIIADMNGNFRLVEIGDGQVSDLKKWSVDDFVNIFLN